MYGLPNGITFSFNSLYIRQTTKSGVYLTNKTLIAAALNAMIYSETFGIIST